jgi:hypothetical protein
MAVRPCWGLHKWSKWSARNEIRFTSGSVVTGYAMVYERHCARCGIAKNKRVRA